MRDDKQKKWVDLNRHIQETTNRLLTAQRRYIQA